MNILAIETSCDETAAAVVSNGTTMLSSAVASSASMHAVTGGIIPEHAARQQLVSLLPILEQALKQAFDNKLPPEQNIDAVAVTTGPGLIGSLLVGIETAKTLGFVWNKPVIAVNHLVGHLYANFVESGQKHTFPQFPALGLVVSGGHTDMVLMNAHGDFDWIGGTRDDAAGEAFDKTARLLGLPYPGGPSIAAAADKHDVNVSNSQISLPRPMMTEKNFDYSFSGLKTAVLKEVGKYKKEDLTDVVRQQFAFEIQEAIVDVLVHKTLDAAIFYKPKSLLLGGGVAANQRLRDKFKSEISKRKLEIDLHIPPPQLCTDNAVYIASCAYFNQYFTDWDEVVARPQLSIMDSVG